MSISKNKKWFLYVLWCSDGSLYTGITTDLEKRIMKHNTGKGAKYTRSRMPCSYAAYAYAGNKSSASKLECKFKKHNRKTKLILINTGLENFVKTFSDLLPENLDPY